MDNTTATQSTENPVVTTEIATTPKVEAALSESATSIELQARAIVINNQEDYENATQFGREVKQAASRVTAYFEPMKEAAHKTHKEICAREKEMLLPLSNAEKTLKSTMGGYLEKVEAERRAAEAEAQRIAKAEADRKLAEAAEHEANGQAAEAESALAEAQMAEMASRNVYIPTAAPTANGASVSKDWEIIGVDEALVPVSLNGIMIRPIDKAAVMRIIKASKGGVQIPGIMYKEKPRIAIRK